MSASFHQSVAFQAGHHVQFQPPHSTVVRNRALKFLQHLPTKKFPSTLSLHKPQIELCTQHPSHYTFVSFLQPKAVTSPLSHAATLTHPPHIFGGFPLKPPGKSRYCVSSTKLSVPSANVHSCPLARRLPDKASPCLCLRADVFLSNNVYQLRRSLIPAAILAASAYILRVTRNVSLSTVTPPATGFRTPQCHIMQLPLCHIFTHVRDFPAIHFVHRCFSASVAFPAIYMCNNSSSYSMLFY